MLLHHLETRGAGIFTDLPFVLQMHIVSFSPNLPKLPTDILKLIQYHLKKRICGSCGSILPVWHDKYICTCRRSRAKKFFSPPTRVFQTYIRPSVVFRETGITLTKLREAFEQSKQLIYVSSNQPEFVYSLKTILNRPPKHFVQYLDSDFDRDDLVDIFIRKQINTNTCLRNYLDLFFNAKEMATEKSVETIRAFRRRDSKNFRVISRHDLIRYGVWDPMESSRAREAAHIFLNRLCGS